MPDYKRNPFINSQLIIENIVKAIEEVKSQLNEARIHHPNYLESDELPEVLSDYWREKLVSLTLKKN